MLKTPSSDGWAKQNRVKIYQSPIHSESTNFWIVRMVFSSENANNLLRMGFVVFSK
jgi:hypothetical protein